ncbi:MAG: V-type ATP synthase subunit F [Lachnospiraceae bacterium]|nr:V-type ATP synthase subunit F [Lachnospiraceae bacterium]
MYRMAVLGDKDSIYGYAALGMEVCPVTDESQAARKLRELAEGDYAVIYVTEALAAKIPGEIDRYREQMLPAVILIPGVYGNTGAGIANVKKSVEQAVGSDILFGNQ